MFTQIRSFKKSRHLVAKFFRNKCKNDKIYTDVEKIVYCTWSPRPSITFEQPAKSRKAKNSINCENLNNFNLNLKWFLHSKVYQMNVLNKTIEIGTPDTKPQLMKGHLSQVVKYILVQSLGDPWNYSLRGKKNIPPEIFSAIEKFFCDTQLLASYNDCRFSLNTLIKKQVSKALRITKKWTEKYTWKS